MTRAFAALLCAGALAAATAGCGGDDGGGSSALAKFAPVDAPVYVEGAIRPEGDLKSSIESILGRFPNGDAVGEKLVQSIDDSAEQGGDDFSYEQDIEPWLGEHAAFFATSFETGKATAGDGGATELKDGAVLAETTDEGQALESIKKLASSDGPVTESDYNGVTIELSKSKDNPGDLNAAAVTGGVAIAGSQQGVKDAIDASTGENFSGQQDFADFSGQEGGDALLTAFVDPQALIAAIPPSRSFGEDQRQSLQKAYGDALQKPVMAGLLVSDGQATLDISSGSTELAPTEQTKLLDSGFAESWAAAGFPGIGKVFANLSDSLSSFGLTPAQRKEFNAAFEQQAGFSFDDLAELGDAAVFAAGTSIDELQVGGIIEIPDAGVRNKLLAAFKKGLEGSDASVRPQTLEGADQAFSVSVPGLPIPINVAVKGDEVVIGGGAATEALLSPAGGLADSDGFKQATDALGDGISLTFLVQVPPIVELVDSTGDAGSDFEQARPYLDAFDLVAVGAKQDGDRTLSRTVVRFSG